MRVWKLMGTVAVATSLVACGGGGSGISDASTPDTIDVSAASAMYEEYLSIKKELTKSTYETQTDYISRINNFAINNKSYSTIYNPTDVFNFYLEPQVNYDAESNEFWIKAPTSITLPVNPGTTELYGKQFSDGYFFNDVIIDDVQIKLNNTNLLFTPITRNIYSSVTKTSRPEDYYTVIKISNTDAEKISKGFRFELEFTMSLEQMQSAGVHCNGAYLTNCSVEIDVTTSKLKLKNIINNNYYNPQTTTDNSITESTTTFNLSKAWDNYVNTTYEKNASITGSAGFDTISGQATLTTSENSSDSFYNQTAKSKLIEIIGTINLPQEIITLNSTSTIYFDEDNSPLGRVSEQYHSIITVSNKFPVDAPIGSEGIFYSSNNYTDADHTTLDGTTTVTYRLESIDTETARLTLISTTQSYTEGVHKTTSSFTVAPDGSILIETELLEADGLSIMISYK